MIIQVNNNHFQAEHIVRVEMQNEAVRVYFTDAGYVVLNGKDANRFLDQWSKVVKLEQMIDLNQKMQAELQQRIAEAMQAKAQYEQAMQGVRSSGLVIPR